MARGLAGDVAKLVRVARDLPRFLRTPLDADAAAGAIRARLATREATFLAMAVRSIYGRPSSPYVKLLRAAGCELADLRQLVESDGLEPALERLAAAGVYLTFEEFKGRKDVVRGSQRFTMAEDEFDNPDLTPHLEARSGGSRSPGTSVKMALPYLSELAAYTCVALHAHGLARHEHAVWIQVATPGLICAGLGKPPLAWFHPVRPLARKTRAVAWYMSLVARLARRRLPAPTFLGLEDPGRLVEWLLARRRAGKSVCLTTYASSAVRVCLAAAARGLSLDGVCFITLGEPFTEAKRAAVEAVGARALVRYAFTEAGIIGFGCGAPEGSDDLHFFEDGYGLIQRSRALGDAGPRVDALLFTALLPSAPKILLNVESGDAAVRERRDCGCALEALGLRTHLSRIRSFEKLSGEGMTFAHTDLLWVLEEALPARFGGTSADYQVVETEGEHGILRVSLLVSPRVGPLDEGEVRERFLRALGRAGATEADMAELWRRAGAVEVRRDWPRPTRAGKILPFHLAPR
jgi:hypothetical protein